jgi:hypothetical protein
MVAAVTDQSAREWPENGEVKAGGHRAGFLQGA